MPISGQSEGGYEEIGVQEGGVVWFYNFVLFQRNVFIIVDSIKWYMISSFWKPNILYVAT